MKMKKVPSMLAPSNVKTLLKYYEKGFLWSVLDSNQRPLPCQGSALNQLS